MSSYRYTAADFSHLVIVVAEDDQHNIIDIAAWELADAKDAPKGLTALLLHGIYVDPSHHRQGIGRRLFLAAEQAICNHHCDGLLVKAQEDAVGIFIALGMNRLPVEDPLRHYANRLWKSAGEIVKFCTACYRRSVLGRDRLLQHNQNTKWS